ncbi:MAG TPA: hypothetical protein VKP04_07975, partial [Ktedonobacteraceae bacterium]|nr:hypothetical protein [Ktedonobacteraceae bacterium]
MQESGAQAVSVRPPFWKRFSISMGNLVQIIGLIIGAALMYLAAHLEATTFIRVILMIVGWLTIYSCCHAIGHYVVGRLFGIRFRGYGIRGTDHPEDYPPGMRQLMSIFPMFTVMTEKASIQKAS